MPQILGGRAAIAGFDPRSIPGCQLWLDAADSSTLTLSGSNVTAWGDKSGSNIGVSGGTSPVVSNINGVQSLYFNGSSTRLSNASLPSPISQPYSFFVVAHQTVNTNAYARILTNETILFIGSSNDKAAMFTGIGYAWNDTLATSYTTLSNTTLYAGAVSGANMTDYLNGTLYDNKTGSYTASSVTRLDIGAVDVYGQYYGGHICEIIFYSGALVTTQRQQIEGYLAWKWGIQTNQSFVPTSIPGCQLWLDASDSSTVTRSGSNVTVWADKSGNGNNTTAVGGSPVYISNGINGLGVVSLSSTYFTGNFATTYTGSNLNCFAVATMNTGTYGYGRILSLGRPGVNDYNDDTVCFPFIRNNGGQSLIVGRNGQYLSADIPAYDTPFIVQSSQISGTEYISVNSSTLYSRSTSTSAFNISSYGVGVPTNTADTQYYTGYIAEILYYTGAALTTAQVKQVEAYLSKKWNIVIPSTLPIVHPNYSLKPYSRPFNPVDIPGCQLWLDAADSSMVVLTGSNVTSWNDKSGNGYNFSNNASLQQPTISNNAINNLNSISFTGTGTLGTASTQVLVNATIPISGSAYSIFVVSQENASHPSHTGYNYILKGGATSDYYLFYGANGGSFTTFTGSSSAWNDIAVNLPSKDMTVANQTSIVVNGSSMIPYYNGTALVQKNGTTANFTGFIIGDAPYPSFTGQNWGGLISEIIVFNNALTTSQRLQVEGYLAWKWGFQTSPPFVPTSISGCQLWLDAADSTTITTSAGNMTQWNDKSGNGNTMTPYSTYSNVTLSSAYQNGLTVLNFSGGGVYKAPASSAVYPLDLYVVLALKDTTTDVDVISINDNVSTSIFNSLTFSEYTTSRWHNGSDYFNRTPNTVSPSNETSTSFILMNWSIANSNYVLRRNGVQLSQTSSYTFTLASGSIFQIGARLSTSYLSTPDHPFKGYIGEIIAFNSQLTSTQRLQVEGYLAAKWGVGSSLPSAHSFAKIYPSLNVPPAYYDASYGRWTYDIQPALLNVASANSSITPTTSNLTGGATYASQGWQGGVLAPNGKIYCPALNGGNILVLDPVSKTTSTFTGGATYTSYGWVAGALASNGKIYCAPYYAANVLVIDPTTNTTSNLTGTATYTTSGGWAGNVLAPNGKIYCVPAAAANVLVIDPVANTTSNLTGGAAFTTYGWQGGVLAPNGKIYCIPGSATNVLVIDPVANTTSNFTGGATYTVNGWQGGVLAPNGKIYCVPTGATNVLVIDPATNTTSNLTGSATYTSSGWTGGVLAPNGKIYCIPGSATNVLVIDPVANTTSNLVGSATYRTSGWSAGTLAADGTIYGIPCLAANFFVMTFSGLTQTVPSNILMSPYFNKF